jgi:RNA polymerase-binding transcription factor DksA
MSTHLSAQQRSALRLDLEDRQSELIVELYSLSRRLLAPLRSVRSVPESWRLALGESRTDPIPVDEVEELKNMGGELEALYRVNRALARLDSTAYGICDHCRDRIGFESLAADPTLDACPDCGSGRAG